jgi:hypothetical protein
MFFICSMAKKNCAFRSALVKALKRVVEIWLEETTLDEMDALWNEGRRNENGGAPRPTARRIWQDNLG